MSETFVVDPNEWTFEKIQQECKNPSHFVDFINKNNPSQEWMDKVVNELADHMIRYNESYGMIILLLLDKGAELENTELINQVWKHNSQLFKRLIDLGYDVKSPNHVLNTLCAIGLDSDCKNLNPDSLDILLNKYQLYELESYFLRLAYYLSTHTNATVVFKTCMVLIKHGVSVSCLNTSLLNSLFYHCVVNDEYPLAKQLLEYGVNVNYQVSNTYKRIHKCPLRPIDYAVRNNNVEMFKVLFSPGVKKTLALESQEIYSAPHVLEFLTSGTHSQRYLNKLLSKYLHNYKEVKLDIVNKFIQLGARVLELDNSCIRCVFNKPQRDIKELFMVYGITADKVLDAFMSL